MGIQKFSISITPFQLSKIRFWLVLLTGILIFSSCNTTKYLKEDEYLLKKNEIEVATEADERETGSLYWQLYYQTKQKPNRKWLRLFRPRLWWYYKAQNHIEKQTYLDTATLVMASDTSSFYKSILKRYAEPPVLYSPELAYETAQRMEYKLNNKGFYDAKVAVNVATKGKFATITYKVTTDELMRMNQINYSSDDSGIQKLLPELEEGSLLKENGILESSTFSKEKNRLVNEIKNRGYKNFYPNYILYEGDSSGTQTKVNVVLVRPTDSTYHKKFTIKNVYVHVDYNPAQSMQFEYDTLVQDNYHFIVQQGVEPFVKLKTLTNAIFLKEGELFQQKNQDKTTVQLGKLGIYKFVNIKSKDFVNKSTGKHHIDFSIYLTPSKKMSISGNVDLNFIVGDKFIGQNVLGASLSATYINRNLFKGAEQLTINAGIGREVPVSAQTGLGFSNAVSTDFRLQGDLLFPTVTERNSNNRITSSYNIITRASLFDNTSLSFATGRDSKLSENLDFSVNLPTISFITYELDTGFVSLIGEDPRYNSQTIMGSSFGLQFNKQNKLRNTAWIVNTTADFSGSVLYTIDQFINPDSAFTFGRNNIPYSQFAILEVDARYFKTFNRDITFAFRINTGAGFSFLNSEETGIPYTHQFFVGGTNSIRGWRERQLGPGGYQGDIIDNENNVLFFNTGDFKFQTSAEVRFSMDAIFSGLEGAYFIDAGNVWMLKGNSPTDVRALRADNFMNRIAIASGLGFRLDLSFVMFRFDLGLKIRRSYGTPDADGFEPLNTYWEFFGPGRSSLGFQDIQGQIGIGYPF